MNPATTTDMQTTNRFIRRLVFAGMCLAGVHADSRQPNIVLILADDVGREVLGCYGGTSYQTPNIDRLAAGGMRFEHAYVMPVCHPTRITLLTGQYPFRLGHPEWGTFPRDTENRTLANVFKRAGYATAIAGKWQLALLKDDLQQPYRMGFDEYCLYGWHEGPWYYQPHLWQNGKRRTDVRDRYGPDVVCDYLLDFIERSKSQPFLAFYSLELCHSETNDLDEPAPFGPHGRYDSFAEMVARMDERVGRVVSAIDRLGLRENTLIVYLSDNGTAEYHLISAAGKDYIYEKNISKMGDREIVGGKATLTDRGTRVPLILNWPGAIAPGKVNSDLIDGSDMLPTLAKVAGAQLPTDGALNGRVMPAFAPQEAAPRSWVFAEYRDRCFVRNRSWKLYNDGSFYDMDADPDEQQPLATDALSPAAAAAHRELQQALDSLRFVAPPR
jgi:arylsulfatase A